MAILKFKISDVKRLAEEFKREDVNKGYTYEQLQDKQYWKEGVKPEYGDHGHIKNARELIDRDKLPAAFHLVKDHGIYLMSCMDIPLEEGERRDVVYTEGADPDRDGDWYNYARSAVGGEDFAVIIPLSWLETLIEHHPKARFLKIKVTPIQIELVY